MVKDNQNSTLKTVQSEGSLKLSRNWDPVPTTKDSKPAELRSRAVDYYSHSRFTLLKMGGGGGAGGILFAKQIMLLQRNCEENLSCIQSKCTTEGSPHIQLQSTLLCHLRTQLHYRWSSAWQYQHLHAQIDAQHRKQS